MNIRTCLRKAPITRLGIGVLLSVIAFGCIKTPLEPIMPASDIQMSIPIIDRLRTLGQLYTKPSSNVYYVDSLQTEVYQSSQTTKPLSLDTLKATPRDQSSVVALGEITLPGISAVGDTVSLSQMGITAGTWPASPAPAFGPATARLPGISLPANTQFDWLSIDSGTVTLTVKNTLPLQITFPQGLSLKNNSNNPPNTSTVALFNIGLVDSAGTSGSTVTKSVTLNKQMIYAALATDSIVLTTSQRSGPFTFSPTAGVTFTFSSGNFLVDSASAVIPNQVIVPKTDSLFTVDDSIVVQTADFRSGSFNAVIQNHSNVTVAMFLQFNDLKHIPDGANFIIDQNLTPNSTNSYPVNLSQYEIQTTPSQLGTKLYFRLGINSIQSGGKVPITNKDYISAGIQVSSPFVIKSVTGKIKPTTLVVNTGMPGLGGDVTKFSAASVNFSSQSITLDLGVSSGFVTDYNLTLKGIARKTNQTVTMVIPPPAGSSQNRIIPAPGKLAQIVLNNSTGFDTFLNSFFQAIPDTFILSGTVTLNPPDVFQSGGFAYIADTSKLYSSVDFFFPLKVGISNAQYTDVIPIKGKFDSAFVADVKSGSLYFSVDNGLPLSLGFLATFQEYDPTTRAARILLTVPVNSVPQTIYGAKVNTITGVVTSDSTTNFGITLDLTQIQQLVEADSVALLFQLSTSSAPTPVVFDSAYTILVRASATMTYTVNKKKN